MTPIYVIYSRRNEELKDSQPAQASAPAPKRK